MTTLFGKDHVDRYIGTDGEEGYRWVRDTTILILTTTGRRSGEPRPMPLIFREWNGKYVIVASKGGAPDNPAWYKNLEANPEVEVQIKADRFAATARDATPEEYPQLWKLMTEAWPDYEEYQKKTGRQIPIVVLERV